MSKNVPNTGEPAELAGLTPEDLPSAQESVPAPYFAGCRRLKLLWIMEPVDQFTQKSKGTPTKK